MSTPVDADTEPYILILKLYDFEGLRGFLKNVPPPSTENVQFERRAQPAQVTVRTFNPLHHNSVESFIRNMFDILTDRNIVSVVFIGHGSTQKLMASKEHDITFDKLLGLCNDYFGNWTNLNSILFCACQTGKIRLGFAPLIACLYPKLLVLAWDFSQYASNAANSSLLLFIPLIKHFKLNKHLLSKWRLCFNDNTLIFNLDDHKPSYELAQSLAKLFLESKNLEIFRIFCYFSCFNISSTFLEEKVQILEVTDESEWGNVIVEINNYIPMEMIERRILETCSKENNQNSQYSAEQLSKLKINDLAEAIILGSTAGISIEESQKICLDRWKDVKDVEDFEILGTALLLMFYNLGKNQATLYKNCDKESSYVMKCKDYVAYFDFDSDSQSVVVKKINI